MKAKCTCGNSGIAGTKCHSCSKIIPEPEIKSTVRPDTPFAKTKLIVTECCDEDCKDDCQCETEKSFKE